MQDRPPKSVSLIYVLLGQLGILAALPCYRSWHCSQSVSGQDGGRSRHIVTVEELE